MITSYPTDTPDWGDVKTPNPGEVAVDVARGQGGVFSPATGKVAEIAQVPRSWYERTLSFFGLEELSPAADGRVITIVEQGTGNVHKLWPLLGSMTPGSDLVKQGNNVWAGVPIGWLSDSWRRLSWKITAPDGKPIDPIAWLGATGAMQPEAARAAIAEEAQAVPQAIPPVKAQSTSGGFMFGAVAVILAIGFATNWGRKK